MQEKIYLDKELDRFMLKIRSGENFALLRFGDGERAIMENRPVHTGDGWSSPGQQTSLGAALNDALALDGANVYHGISCPCCDRAAYYWYMTRVPRRENVTFSNLFVNANYRRFIAEFQAINRDTIVIANHKWGGGGIIM